MGVKSSTHILLGRHSGCRGNLLLVHRLVELLRRRRVMWHLLGRLLLKCECID